MITNIIKIIINWWDTKMRVTFLDIIKLFGFFIAGVILMLISLPIMLIEYIIFKICGIYDEVNEL
jgi:hypothetical protein